METKERFERIEKSLAELEAFGQKTGTSLKTAQSALVKKNEALADLGCCAEVPPPASKYDIEYLNSRIQWIKDDMKYFTDAFYKHMEGHLPPIVGASDMKKALKAIGLDGDYDVQKRVIYASDGTAKSEQWITTRPL